MKQEIRIGTRGSKLALWQANYIKLYLENNFSDISASIHVIQTKGDINLKEGLSSLGGKGAFVKEIQNNSWNGIEGMKLNDDGDKLLVTTRYNHKVCLHTVSGSNIGSTCTETLSVSSSNLPEGVTVSLDNNQITIQGTPSSNSIGSFDYEIILNLADPEAILTGSIIVDNNTTTETNQNSGGGGTDSSSNTTNDNIISSSPDSSTSSDTVSPVQTLIGESTVTLYVGDRYIEQGAFGIDDVDGNISNLMEIDNQSVNTSSPGTYIVSYDTKDAAGNQAITIYRTVIVLENTSNINTSTSSSTNSGTSTVTSDTNSTLDTFTINVTASSSSDYTLSGSDRIGSVSGADPSVTVNVGDNLNFSVDAIGHPFYLKTVQGTGINDLISDVSNNGIVEGTVSWTPTVAGTYYYQCSLHNAMYGVINVN